MTMNEGAPGIVLVTGTAAELDAAIATEANNVAREEARLIQLALTHWIVFLDIDGVLNHRDFFCDFLRAPGEMLDRACVARLNELLIALDAVVVVSSSWRQTRTIRELQAELGAYGFTGTIVGKTPSRVANPDRLSKRPLGGRGDEIRAWLDTAPEPTERFIALDDDVHMDAVRGHWVQTYFDGGGLTGGKVAEALRLARSLGHRGALTLAAKDAG